MSFIAERKKPILIALIQWFLTTVLQVDRLYFSYTYETIWYIRTKALYLLALLAIWCFIFKAVRRIKAGDAGWRRGFFIFKVYLFITMCMLLVLWPGTWAWDDLATLHNVKLYTAWHPWQHVITGAYQDVLLQILPFPGGIILLQNVIISLCVAFAVTKLEAVFGVGRLRNRALDTLVKLLPFLLPPVFMYQFSGYRMGLYVYIELVMLVMLIAAWKEEREWSAGYSALFCLLCVIVSSWRTESFVYIPCTVLLFFFISKKVIPNIKKVLCLALIIMGFLGLNRFQNQALGNANYEVISLMRPCVELIREADPALDADELEAIDKVVSIEGVRNNPKMNGEDIYWRTETVRKDYSDEAFSDFLKAFVKLSVKYPKTVLTERLDLFIKASGIGGNTTSNVSRAAKLFDEGSKTGEDLLSSGWIAVSPVFREARKAFIYFLGMYTREGTPNTVSGRLIWNAMIPLLVLAYAWIKLILKRNWYWWVVCSAVLVKVPIVALTQPSGWLMYLLPFYFLGYVYLVYKLLSAWSAAKKAKEYELR